MVALLSLILTPIKLGKKPPPSTCAKGKSLCCLTGISSSSDVHGMSVEGEPSRGEIFVQISVPGQRDIVP